MPRSGWRSIPLLPAASGPDHLTERHSGKGPYGFEAAEAGLSAEAPTKSYKVPRAILLSVT